MLSCKILESEMFILHTHSLCWAMNIYRAMQTSAFSLFIPNTGISAVGVEFLHCSGSVATGSEGPACFSELKREYFLLLLAQGQRLLSCFHASKSFSWVYAYYIQIVLITLIDSEINVKH